MQILIKNTTNLTQIHKLKTNEIQNVDASSHDTPSEHGSLPWRRCVSKESSFYFDVSAAITLMSWTYKYYLYYICITLNVNHLSQLHTHLFNISIISESMKNKRKKRILPKTMFEIQIRWGPKRSMFFWQASMHPTSQHPNALDQQKRLFSFSGQSLRKMSTVLRDMWTVQRTYYSCTAAVCFLVCCLLCTH